MLAWKGEGEEISSLWKTKVFLQGIHSKLYTQLPNHFRASWVLKVKIVSGSWKSETSDTIFIKVELIYGINKNFKTWP